MNVKSGSTEGHYIFTEKHPHINEPTQLKPVLLKTCLWVNGEKKAPKLRSIGARKAFPF